MRRIWTTDFSRMYVDTFKILPVEEFNFKKPEASDFKLNTRKRAIFAPRDLYLNLMSRDNVYKKYYDFNIAEAVVLDEVNAETYYEMPDDLINLYVLNGVNSSYFAGKYNPFEDKVYYVGNNPDTIKRCKEVKCIRISGDYIGDDVMSVIKKKNLPIYNYIEFLEELGSWDDNTYAIDSIHEVNGVVSIFGSNKELACEIMGSCNWRKSMLYLMYSSYLDLVRFDQYLNSSPKLKMLCELIKRRKSVLWEELNMNTISDDDLRVLSEVTCEYNMKQYFQNKDLQDRYDKMCGII